VFIFRIQKTTDGFAKTDIMAWINATALILTSLPVSYPYLYDYIEWVKPKCISLICPSGTQFLLYAQWAKCRVYFWQYRTVFRINKNALLQIVFLAILTTGLDLNTSDTKRFVFLSLISNRT